MLWKDIAGGVPMDADKLFKMIGEAYNVLSDPIKVPKREFFPNFFIEISRERFLHC